MVQQPPGPPPGGMQPPPPPPGQPPQAPVGPPKPQLDMSKVPLPDIIVAVSALIFLILTGIGWYNFAGFTEARAKGAMGALGLVVGILVLLFAVVMIANEYLNFLPMELPSGLIYLGATGLILLFLVVGIFVKPSVGGFGYEATYDVGWVIWIISLIFALGIGAGGFMKVQKG